MMHSWSAVRASVRGNERAARNPAPRPRCSWPRTLSAGDRWTSSIERRVNGDQPARERTAAVPYRVNPRGDANSMEAAAPQATNPQSTSTQPALHAADADAHRLKKSIGRPQVIRHPNVQVGKQNSNLPDGDE